jgi:DNA-directed RNA polymerase subunit RPC12/RpoP
MREYQEYTSQDGERYMLVEMVNDNLVGFSIEHNVVYLSRQQLEELRTQINEILAPKEQAQTAHLDECPACDKEFDVKEVYLQKPNKYGYHNCPHCGEELYIAPREIVIYEVELA